MPQGLQSSLAVSFFIYLNSARRAGGWSSPNSTTKLPQVTFDTQGRSRIWSDDNRGGDIAGPEAQSDVSTSHTLGVRFSSGPRPRTVTRAGLV